MSQARAIATEQLQCVERRTVTLTKWREGHSWWAVEIDGSCVRQWQRATPQEYVDACTFFDGVVAGLRAAAEP